jgi:predicted dehydrogenase
VLLLSNIPTVQLSAQGVLNEFSYDNIRLSGIQVDLGVLGASQLMGTTVGGVRLDFGRIAPRVRLLLGLSYFKSDFDQESRTKFEQAIDSIVVDPSGDDTISVGKIALGDIVGDIDFQYVFPQGRGITAYVGTGLSIHLRNGSGPAINGTFVEDALDVVTAGLNGTIGFDFNLIRAVRFTVEGRGVLSSGLQTASLRTGLMFRERKEWEQEVGNDPIRVGVIGAGAISQVAHLPVLRRLQGVEVAAICDNDVGKAQALAGRFDVKDTYDDIEEVLRYANVDVILICTPNHLHEIHVTSALAAGVHVLCERPLALTLAGVERVLAASDRYGKRVMVGMNHRFRSDVQAVRGFLAGGDLGALQAVRGGWYTFQPSRQMLGWRLRREEAGGGAMLDLGLTLIDLGMWLAGWPAPKRISAHLTRSGKDAVEDMASVLMVLENGVSITVDVSWRHLGEGERFWFDIVGARGSAMIQPLRIFREQHGAAVDVTPIEVTAAIAATQSYRAE